MLKPKYSRTVALTAALKQVEAIKQEIESLTIEDQVLAHLRESARMKSIHYSTKIAGNKLTLEEVIEIVKQTQRMHHHKI